MVMHSAVAALTALTPANFWIRSSALTRCLQTSLQNVRRVVYRVTANVQHTARAGLALLCLASCNWQEWPWQAAETTSTCHNFFKKVEAFTN